MEKLIVIDIPGEDYGLAEAAMLEADAFIGQQPDFTAENNADTRAWLADDLKSLATFAADAAGSPDIVETDRAAIAAGNERLQSGAAALRILIETLCDANEGFDVFRAGGLQAISDLAIGAVQLGACGGFSESARAALEARQKDALDRRALQMRDAKQVKNKASDAERDAAILQVFGADPLKAAKIKLPAFRKKILDAAGVADSAVGFSVRSLERACASLKERQIRARQS